MKYCKDCNRKLSKDKYQYCRSCALKRYWAVHPERRQKIRKCIDCGEIVKHYHAKRCHSCSQKGKLNTMFDRKKELCPAWVGGTANLPYPFEFNDELKEEIRKRDNYKCQGENCSMTEEEHLIVIGEVLNVHHIDYDKKNCNENNLISLCRQCNVRANYNRNYWKQYFERKANACSLLS